MSKASEWAEALHAVATRPRWENDYAGQVLVDDYGDMVIKLEDDQWELDPEAALALARWIIDTFGEA